MRCSSKSILCVNPVSIYVLILCNLWQTKHSVWIWLPSHRNKIFNSEMIHWIKCITGWSIFCIQCAPHGFQKPYVPICGLLDNCLEYNKPGRYDVKASNWNTRVRLRENCAAVSFKMKRYQQKKKVKIAPQMTKNLRLRNNEKSSSLLELWELIFHLLCHQATLCVPFCIAGQLPRITTSFISESSGVCSNGPRATIIGWRI